MDLVKPDDMFDRDREWSSLSRFAGSGLSNATLGVVSGRIRQGKTFLLQALCAATGGLYIAAKQASEAESLRSIGEAIADFQGSSLVYSPQNWKQAIDALLAIGDENNVPVVIDEFPYLVKASPQLPSVIQAALGPRRKEYLASRTRLLLCGSAMSFMGSLLSGSAPLRGRAGLELVVHTLDYRLAAEFWGIDDPSLAIRVNAVAGGTPAYRRQFVEEEVPTSVSDFDSWMLRHPLNPGSPLFREARYLLSEEPDIRDPGLYNSVLAAVASGHSTSGGISSFVGRKSSDIAHPLHVLEDSGLLRRHVDAFRKNRSIFQVNEPLITFYHSVLRPNWAEWDQGRGLDRLWSQARPRFSSQVLGPRFEQICRDWAQMYAACDVFGDFASRVESGTVNDPEKKCVHEIDVAVFGLREDGSEKLLAIGEAKWAEKPTTAHVERLERVRSLLSKHWDTSETKLTLFNGHGFSDSLRQQSARDDLVLVDLNDLYGRS